MPAKGIIFEMCFTFSHCTDQDALNAATHEVRKAKWNFVHLNRTTRVFTIVCAGIFNRALMNFSSVFTGLDRPTRLPETKFNGSEGDVSTPQSQADILFRERTLIPEQLVGRSDKRKPKNEDRPTTFVLRKTGKSVRRCCLPWRSVSMSG